jgi:flagellar motor protein MotB
VEGRALELAFTDGMRKELPNFTVSGLSFEMEDVTGPLAGPIAFKATARIGKDANLETWGTVVPTPLAADVKLELTGFRLADGGPYLPEGVDLTIAEGRMDLRLAAVVATREDLLTGTYGGSAAVRSLRLLDRKGGKLLAWDRLSIDGVKGTLEPMTLTISRIGLSGLRADLVKRADGKLNFPEIPKPPPGTGTGRSPTKAQRDEGFESIRIDQFVMGGGTVNFTDEGVPGGFHATLQDVSVRVTGMSTEPPGKFADVRAQLTLPRGAPLRISGKAAPLKKPAYADLDLVLEGLDLAVASPYAGTYLGLEVDRGALNVKSRVRVEQGNLAAENRIRVDQLTYGKAVKSDKATILPVRLLTDILRDRNGDIVLDLPVQARTDDEDLAGTLTGQIVKNVILPPGSPLRNIVFAPCSAAVDPDAQGRLRKLAEALQERPAMKIVAVGYVDQEVDGKACRDPAMAEKAAVPPLEGEARMRQLAEARATAVRDFLVVQGNVEATRVSAATGDVHAAPAQKGEKQARVEFARATD